MPDPLPPQSSDSAFMELVVRYLDNQLSDPELQLFKERLAVSDADRAIFVRIAGLHGLLMEAAGNSHALLSPATDPPEPAETLASLAAATAHPPQWHVARIKTASTRLPPSRRMAWRIAAIFIFIASAVFTLTSPTWTGWWRSTPVATLADAVDAQWDAPQTRLDVGDHLPYGPLYLKSGYASIRLDNGVKLVVVGPAHFSIDSLKLAHLDEGKLTADVPHAASGYSVKIPSGLVTDIGTIFGVTAFANTESSVQVLKGSVQAQLFSDDGKPKDKIVLTEDHAVALSPIAGTLASIPAQSDAYVTNIHRIPVQLVLHNTGQGLKQADADPSWQIVANSDDPQWTPQAAIVALPEPFAWLANSADSQWLSTAAVPSDMSDNCQLTFRTTLDLTGVDPDSIHLHLKILADNDVPAVRLNGQTAPIKLLHKSADQRLSFVDFQTFDLDGGFVAGKNTLELVVLNTPMPGNARARGIKNVMGLRVEFDGTAVRTSEGATK